MIDRCPFRVVRRAWFLLLCAAPAAAQGVAPATPISLMEGVRTTLEKAPTIQLAREDVAAQQASLRQARGQFDSIVQVGPLLEHREDNIENTAFFNPEQVKRGFARGLSNGFRAVADALADQIRLGRGDLPLCPFDGANSQYFVTLPGTVLPVPICRPASLSQAVQLGDNLSGGSANNSFLFRQALPFDPLSSFQLQAILASAFRVQIATASLEARERGAELLLTLQQAARIVDIKAGLTADRLAELPKFVYANTASLFAFYTKPLRSGSVFQFDVKFDGRAQLFRDKPIDPTFGGTDNRNAFTNKLEWSWTQPLKRGQGAESVQAAERGALKNVEASRYGFQQTAADQVLATTDAYVGLIEAQNSYELTRQSLETQRQMLDNAIRQVGAGDIAAVDLARQRARASEVESELASARLVVVSAQQRLADAMGVESADVTTLTASDTFPATPIDLDIDALSRDAVARRADVKALTAFRDTSRILLAGARADTRLRFDLRLSGGFGQAYFGPTFHSLFDENGQHVDNDLYVRYYDATGFRRAFTQKWEPIASVTARFELPFGNNQRLGRLAQAAAGASESEIRVVDLSRSIQNTVPKIAETLRRLRAEWEQRQEVVVQYEATWDTTQRLRAAGDATLIDTLLTEQQLTQARIALVQTKRDYASAAARFRRETGTLVDFTGAGGQPNLGGIVAGR